MYVVSCVDVNNIRLANPLGDPLYVYLPCITRVYVGKQEFINNENLCIGYCTTKVLCLLSAVRKMRYPDSPLMIPYTTHLAEMEMDWEFRVEGNMEPLRLRVKACHERYLQYFEQIADRDDEMLAVAETFANIRNVMQRLNAT